MTQPSAFRRAWRMALGRTRDFPTAPATVGHTLTRRVLAGLVGVQAVGFTNARSERSHGLGPVVEPDHRDHSPQPVASSAHRPRPRIPPSAIAVARLVTAILAMAIWIATLPSPISEPIDWAQLASVLLAVAAVASMIKPTVVGQSARRPAVAVPTADQLDHAQRTLAALVRGQWREEILVRQLDDPFPMTVRWRLTERPVMDHHDDVIRSSPLPLRIWRGPRRFAGRSNRVGELADEFRRLPRQRLVILGGPGMGKTTMAMLLVRELLRRYDSGQPVPVLLAISDWNPDEEELHGWLIRRLTETYPALRAADFGPNTAAALITQGRILLVLDGLDELPERVRSGALAALNASLTADDALILTCRTAEYEAAINGLGGLVLTGGAVIELDPLRPGDITAYLRGCLREPDSGSWPTVFSALADPNKPIAQALTTPLELWLVRKVYIDTGADPGELLDTRFPTATEITGHLLDHLVPAAITAHRRWDPDEAVRWLSFLAAQLYVEGSRDIGWWRLHRAIPRIRLVRRFLLGLVLGSVFGSAAGLMGALGGGFVAHPLAGFTAGLVGGFIAGLALGLGVQPAAGPAYASLRLRGRGRALAKRITYRLGMMGVAVGLTFVVMIGLGSTLSVAVLEIGLTSGIAGGLLIGVLEWVATPLPYELAQTPTSTLQRDLRLLFGRMISALLAGGLVLGLMAGFVGGSVSMLLGIEGVAAVLVMYGPVRWTVTASSIYLCTIAVLHAQRNLPWRLMRFLDDAHRAGLLRQVGPVYQFRNAVLQDRLANTYHRRT